MPRELQEVLTWVKLTSGIRVTQHYLERAESAHIMPRSKEDDVARKQEGRSVAARLVAAQEKNSRDAALKRKER